MSELRDVYQEVIIDNNKNLLNFQTCLIAIEKVFIVFS